MKDHIQNILLDIIKNKGYCTIHYCISNCPVAYVCEKENNFKKLLELKVKRAKETFLNLYGEEKLFEALL